MHFFNKVSFCTLFVAGILAFTVTPSYAEDNQPIPNRKSFNTLVAQGGVIYSENDNQLVITVNEQKALQNISNAQTLGFIPSDASDYTISQKPIKYTIHAALYYVFAILQYTYLSDRKVDTLNGHIFFIRANGEKNPVADFTITRNINDKINYATLTPATIQSALPDFKYSEWYTKNVEK